MQPERRWKRLIFKWTAPKGFTAIASFLTLAILTEYLVVYSFLSFGLTDKFLFTKTLQIPLTSLFFTITISPLFHFIPLGVITVLVSSWTYLTKYVAVMPREIKPVKKPFKARRKRHPRLLGKRLRPIERFAKRISGKVQKVTRTFKAFYRKISAVPRIRGFSHVLQRLFFAKAAVKGTVTILVVFLLSFFALYVLGYPRLIQDAVTGFYRRNPFFLWLVSTTIEKTHTIAQILSPIGWLASAINNVLLAAAPSFRNALGTLGAPIIGLIAELDLVGKYAVCQNIAAWASAVTALAYGRYASRLYSRHKPP